MASGFITNGHVRGAVSFGMPLSEKPRLQDLYGKVVPHHGIHWRAVGIGLGLVFSVVDTVGHDFHNSNDRLRRVLEKWLQLDGDNATWGRLELVITNVQRAELGLEPIETINWLGSVNTTEANTRIPTNTGSFVTANEVCINSEADGATKVTTNTSSYTTIDDKPSSPGNAFIVYEMDNSIGEENLLCFADFLRSCKVNCDIDYYHSIDDSINDWNLWAVKQIKNISVLGGYILLVCTPSLLEKLESSSNCRIEMKHGHIYTYELNALIKGEHCPDRFIPIIPTQFINNKCVPLSLVGRTSYIVTFNNMLKYDDRDGILNTFHDIEKLVAKLIGENLVPKPPIAPTTPTLTKRRRWQGTPGL